MELLIEEIGHNRAVTPVAESLDINNRDEFKRLIEPLLEEDRLVVIDMSRLNENARVGSPHS